MNIEANDESLKIEDQLKKGIEAANKQRWPFILFYKLIKVAGIFIISIG